MKNVLVTGGNGFIATNFIKKALNIYNIISLDNLSYAGSLDNHVQFANNTNYKFIEQDIRDSSIANTLIDNSVDILINFAAQSHVDNSIFNDKDFISTNINGTHNLLSICNNLLENKKLADNFLFIQISTDEVYGSLDKSDKPFTEMSLIKPSNPYSASKASADLICESYYKTHNFPVIITRCSNNYGPYQYPEKLIPLTIKRLLNNKKIPIYGNGLQIRDWIYVDDHAQGVLDVIEHGLIGNVYNFGGNSEITNIDLVQQIINYIKPGENPSKHIKHVSDRKGHDTRYAINSAKSSSQLQWKAETNFSKGINKTIDWYLENIIWLMNKKMPKQSIDMNKYLYKQN